MVLFFEEAYPQIYDTRCFQKNDKSDNPTF